MVLAAKTELSARTIQRIENGEVDPRSYSLQMIADALEVDFSIFTKQENEEPPHIQNTNHHFWNSMLHLSGLLPLVFPAILIWSKQKDKNKEMAPHFKAALGLQLVILGISIGTLWLYYKTGMLQPFYEILLAGALMPITNALRALDGKKLVHPFFKLQN